MSAASAIVAMGGRSLEREISLRGGRRVERALRELGYSVRALDADGDFVARLIEQRPDFVFVAMHGRGGEDGTLQDLLQTLAVPYTGSDPLASALCISLNSSGVIQLYCATVLLARSLANCCSGA